MRSIVKEYNKLTAQVNNKSITDYINEDLAEHQEWKISHILTNNYTFYVVYEIRQPRKKKEPVFAEIAMETKAIEETQPAVATEETN